MEYRILSAIRWWAQAERAKPQHNDQYRAALAKLILAIDNIQKFH